MRFVFIVQGEGRGHMTQAISLYQLLEKEGHEVAAVVVGKSKRREIPEFVKSNLACPLLTFESPNFITDKKGKGVLLGKTISYNFSKLPTFLKSLHWMNQVVNHYSPDIILNFYDLLAGVYNFLYRPKCEFWTIGHQYLISHPEFPFAPHQPIQKSLFIINTKLTALGANKQLALSFRPLDHLPKKNLFVLPPLLRKEIRELSPIQGDFYLAYVVNPGYMDDILAFCKAHPNIKIVAFWDQKGAHKQENPLPNLILNQVNDQLFLEYMAACKGLVCTAGFESVCEAMYLGKQVMVVPVKGQYEQSCNALDTQISGIGIHHDAFDFNKLEAYEPIKNSKKIDAKNWVDSFPLTFFSILPSRRPKKTKKKATSRANLEASLH